MEILDFEKDFEVIKCLICGGELLCSPTDTQFGIIGNALDSDTINKVYEVKKRDRDKPLIVLFNSLSRAKNFGIKVPEKYEKLLQNLWPERVTVILPLDKTSPFKELLNTENIAIRVPKHEKLRKLIAESVPIFAPSANIQNQKPAATCEECKKYFENSIKYCIKGKCDSSPSTIISLLSSENIEILREGAVPSEKILKLLKEI